MLLPKQGVDLAHIREVACGKIEKGKDVKDKNEVAAES
jgi:hypothetical protein